MVKARDSRGSDLIRIQPDKIMNVLLNNPSSNDGDGAAGQKQEQARESQERPLRHGGTESRETLSEGGK